MTALRTSGLLPRLAWAAAARPLAGERVSGDGHVVAPFPGGVLLAVVDALGHGTDAEVAARMAVETLQRHCGNPVDSLVKECHERLRRTRGVAAAIASIDLRSVRLSWISIGNVESMIVPADSDSPRRSIIQLGGIVGYKLPRIPPIERVGLQAGDRIIFATDGIKSGFAEALTVGDPLPDQAAAVLERFEDVRDDALVLIAQYVGAEQ